MKLILQTANIVGDEKNCLYPNRAEVTSAEELQEAVKMDHVCAEYLPTAPRWMEFSILRHPSPPASVCQPQAK